MKGIARAGTTMIDCGDQKESWNPSTLRIPGVLYDEIEWLTVDRA